MGWVIGAIVVFVIGVQFLKMAGESLERRGDADLWKQGYVWDDAAGEYVRRRNR